MPNPANSALTYDSAKLRAEMAALAKEPLTPRMLDILITEEDAVVAQLRAGRTARQIWGAFTRAGCSIGYSAFVTALNAFRDRPGLGIPPKRRKAASPSRFAPTGGASTSHTSPTPAAATLSSAAAGTPAATLASVGGSRNPTRDFRRKMAKEPKPGESTQQNLTKGIETIVTQLHHG